MIDISQQTRGESVLKIQLKKNEERKIREHSERTYPEECCGVLIGTIINKTPHIIEARPMKNINGGTRERRYNIDPLDLIKVDKEVEHTGLELLGIYHSHPNHPSRPSKYDLEHAWPNFSYIILSVEKGNAKEMSSWRLQHNREAFQAETIELI